MTSNFGLTNWPFSQGLLKNTHKIIVKLYEKISMDYSKIAQTLLKKLFNIWNDGIAAASDHAALGVSVIKWRLEVIHHTVQHNALTVFEIAINKKFHKIND